MTPTDEVREPLQLDDAFYTLGPELARQALELELAAFRQGRGTAEQVGQRIGDLLCAHFNGPALSAALGSITGLAPQLFPAVAKRFAEVEVDYVRVVAVLKHADELSPTQQHPFLRDVMEHTPASRRADFFRSTVASLSFEAAYPLMDLVPDPVLLGDDGASALCASMPDLDGEVQAKVLRVVDNAAEGSRGLALARLMYSQPETFLSALRKSPTAKPDRDLCGDLDNVVDPEPEGARLNALCAGFARNFWFYRNVQGDLLKAWSKREWFGSIDEISRAFPAPYFSPSGAVAFVESLPPGLQDKWVANIWDGMSAGNESAAFLKALESGAPALLEGLKACREVPAPDMVGVPVPELRLLGFSAPFATCWQQLTLHALDVQYRAARAAVPEERFWQLPLLDRAKEDLAEKLAGRPDVVTSAIEALDTAEPAVHEPTLAECYAALSVAPGLSRRDLMEALIPIGMGEKTPVQEAALARVVADLNLTRDS